MGLVDVIVFIPIWFILILDIEDIPVGDPVGYAGFGEIMAVLAISGENW